MTSPLVMKPYVTVSGSGRDATILKGNRNITSGDYAASAIVLGADNAVLRDLTIINNGSSGTYSLGLFNQDASPILRNLAINIVGGYGFGVFNLGKSTPELQDIAITVSASIEGNGVYSNSSTSAGGELKMTDVTISVSGGMSTTSHGIYHYVAFPLNIKNITINMSGSGLAYGIYSDSADGVTIDNTYINVSSGVYHIGISINSDNSIINFARIIIPGGSNDRGLNIDSSSGLIINRTSVTVSTSPMSNYGSYIDGSQVKIIYSTLYGSSPVYADNSSVVEVLHSSLSGGGVTVNNSASVSCLSTDNGSNKVLNASCQ